MADDDEGKSGWDWDCTNIGCKKIAITLFVILCFTIMLGRCGA